jgi:hypothetical protein
MASTYLSRSNGTPTSQQIFTFSAWVKRSGLNPSGNNMQFFSIYNDTSNRMDFRFQTGDTIDFYHTSSLGRLTTNRLFRDTNAWYHIVLRVDTTQATSSDRYRLYINGVQETSFSTETQPSQNANLGTNFSTFSIGDDSYGSSDYDGSMAHIHYTDGQSYAPTTFGETDATTGIWKPKTAPSVTYGTNGFFLKFENSGAFGTDSSGNGNTFTVNGTMTQTIDTPSNVFATLNPLDNYYFNSTFSQGNLKVLTNSSNYAVNTSTLWVSGGKWYWEVKVVTSSTNDMIGIANAVSTSTSNYLGANGNGYAYRNAGDVFNTGGSAMSGFGAGTFATYGNGDILMIAMDLDNSKLYFGKNGTWGNSGDPTSGSTGTGAVSIVAVGSTPNGAYTPAISDWNNASSLTAEVNFGNGYFGTTAVSSAQNPDDGIGIFEYSVPTGYKALCTKSINAQEYD